MTTYAARCICRDRHPARPTTFRAFVIDATRRQSAKSDPTGTLPLQRRWSRNLDQRWRAVERMLPGALSQHPATMIAHSLAVGASNPVDLFSQWLAEALHQVVMGDDGSWLLPYVRSATDAGALHARRTTQRVVDAGTDNEPRDDRGRWTAGGGYDLKNPDDHEILLDRTITSPLSHNEEEAIRDHTENGYFDTNRALRFGLNPDTKHLDTVFARASLPVNMKVYRQVDASTYDQIAATGMYHDKGFVSTTADRERLTKHNVITIQLPEGSPAIPVGHVSEHGATESEMLIGRGQHFKVVSRENGLTLRLVKPHVKDAALGALHARKTTQIGDAGDDEPRDDHGRWTVGGGGAELSHTDVEKLEPRWGEVSDKKKLGNMQSAVATYTGSEYDDINSELRKPNDDWTTGPYQTPIRRLDSVFRDVGQKLQQDTKLYRGVSERRWANLKPGDVVTEPTFVSTSNKQSIAQNFAGDTGRMLHLTVPKGTTVIAPLFTHHVAMKGADIEVIGEGAEPEVLLRRGTSFRIDKVEGNNVHATALKHGYLDDRRIINDAAPADRTHLLQSLAVTELQGIVDATVQQAARAYAQGVINKLTPSQIVTALRAVMQKTGMQRGHSLVSFMTVKSFNAAALDGFRSSGISRVGIVPERRPPVRVQTRDADLSGMVNVMTAEDDLVCPECEEIADDGPYYIDEAEALIPAHPNCRCAFAPADEDEADDFDQENLGDSVTHIASGVMITADNTGRVLFVRRGPGGDQPGKWAFPGGAVEPGETPQMAAARETREEIGYDPGIDSLSEAHRANTNGVDFTTYAHSADVEFRPRLNHEHDGYAWRHASNAPQPLHPGVLATLQAQDRELADDQTWNEEEHPRDKDGKFTFAGGSEAALDNVGADVGHVADLTKAEKGTNSGYDEITVPLEHSHLVKASLDKHGLDYDKILLTKKDVYLVKGMKPSSGTNVGLEQTSTTGKIESPVEGATLAKIMQKEGATSLENYPPEEKADKNSHVFTVQNQHKDVVEKLLNNGGYVYTTFKPSGGAKTGYKVPLSSNYITSLTGTGTKEPEPTTVEHPLQSHLKSVNGTSSERVALRSQIKKAKGEDLKYLQHQHNASFWKQHQQLTKQGKTEQAKDIADKLDKYSKSYGISNPLKTAPVMKLTTGVFQKPVDKPTFGKLGLGNDKPEPLPAHSGPQGEPGALDFKSLKKVGEQMGSNAGGTYQSPSGDRYYIKSMDEAHAKNEQLAAKLYALAGSKTLDYVPVKPDGDVHYVATKMENLDKNNVSQLSASERAQARAQFATHAWLANWDAAGTGGDNQGTKGGLVKTLDVGGALEYRAKGSPKGSQFGNDVTEFETMRSGPSHDNNALFGDMSDEALKQSVAKIGAIKDVDIRNTVYATVGQTNGEPLANKLIARKNDLVKRADALGKAPKAADLSHMSDEEQRMYWLKKTTGSGDNSHHTTPSSQSAKAKVEKLGLTPAEVGFIRAFTGPESGVNRNLRDGIMDEHEFAFKHIMNDALAKIPVYDGDKVWRKINLSSDKQAAYKPGKIVHWQAFSSTSKNPNTWSGNTHFTIHNPKTGRDVQFMSENPSEAEVIMPADTYYKVLSNKSSGGVTKIDLEEVLPFGKKQKKAA